MSDLSDKMAQEPQKAGSDRQQWILEAAVNVFAKRGYHRSTVSDIAAEAGVAAGTIYLYFNKKEELLGALFRDHVGRLLQDHAPEVRALEPGRAQLGHLIELYLKFFSDNPKLGRVIQVHLREVNPELREEIAPTIRQLFGLFEDILTSGIQCGAFRPELDLRVARNILFGSLDSSVTAWVLSSKDYSLKAMVPTLTEYLTKCLEKSPAATL